MVVEITTRSGSKYTIRRKASPENGIGFLLIAEPDDTRHKAAGRQHPFAGIGVGEIPMDKPSEWPPVVGNMVTFFPPPGTDVSPLRPFVTTSTIVNVKLIGYDA